MVQVLHELQSSAEPNGGRLSPLSFSFASQQSLASKSFFKTSEIPFGYDLWWTLTSIFQVGRRLLHGCI